MQACVITIILPIVGMVVTISPSLSLYKMVVLPAASRPTISMRISFLAKSRLKSLVKDSPIFNNPELQKSTTELEGSCAAYWYLIGNLKIATNSQQWHCVQTINKGKLQTLKPNLILQLKSFSKHSHQKNNFNSW